MSEYKGQDGLDKSLAQDPKRHLLDGRGCVRTTSLFYETNTIKTLEPIYTLRPYDFEGLLSLKRLYLEEMDSTEYIFANKYMYDYKHWRKVKRNKHIQKYIKDWEEELEVKIRAEAVMQLQKMSKDSGNLGLQAAKFVAQKGWDKAGKGRPSKEEVTAEVRKSARIQQETTEDWNRIRPRKSDESE